MKKHSIKLFFISSKLLKKPILLCPLFLLSGHSISNSQIKWQPNQSNQTTDDWTITTQTIAYLYNYEWFKKHGAQGYTLFGNIVPIYASKKLASDVELNLGAIGYLSYGNDYNNALKPLIKINVGLGKNKNLILGALNQTHDIHQSLSLDNDFYKQELEQGIEFINNSDTHKIDIWANWKIAETIETAEYFEVAALHQWNFWNFSNWRAYSNEQLFVAHKGGQLTNDDSYIRGTWGLFQLTSAYKNHELSLSAHSSSYEDELINAGPGFGAELALHSQFTFNNQPTVDIYAKHYLSENYYNPSAHPGYNQPSFTQLTFDANWLRGDQLNISTGLSLDWINGSFTTVQYLNVSITVP